MYRIRLLRYSFVAAILLLFMSNIAVQDVFAQGTPSPPTTSQAPQPSAIPAPPPPSPSPPSSPAPTRAPQGPCGAAGQACCATKPPTCNSDELVPVIFDEEGKYVPIYKRWRFLGKIREFIFNPKDTCKCSPEDANAKDVVHLCTVEGSVDNECLQCVTSGGFPTSLGCVGFSLISIVEGFYLVGIAVGGAYALMCMIISSIQIQSSRGDAERVSTARQRVTSCMIGLIFLLFAAVLINIVGGGILGFDTSPIESSGTGQPSSPSQSPNPGTPGMPNPGTPGTPGAPNPSQSPNPSSGPVPSAAPPPPSQDTKITSEDINNVLTFYNGIQEQPNCSNIDYNNIDACIGNVNTGVPNEDLAKSTMINKQKYMYDTYKNPNDYYLNCAIFAQGIYGIMVGETFYGEYMPNPDNSSCSKFLKEPFWKFTYYPVGTTTPQVGDLVKWTTGSCGHIAVITVVRSDELFEVIQANTSPTRKRSCPGCVNTGPVHISEAGLAGFYRLVE